MVFARALDQYAFSFCQQSSASSGNPECLLERSPRMYVQGQRATKGSRCSRVQALK